MQLKEKEEGLTGSMRAIEEYINGVVSQFDYLNSESQNSDTSN